MVAASSLAPSELLHKQCVSVHAESSQLTLGAIGVCMLHLEVKRVFRMDLEFVQACCMMALYLDINSYDLNLSCSR